MSFNNGDYDEVNNTKEYDMRFRNPCSFLLCGSSQSGKTTLVLDILSHIDQYFLDPRCKSNVIYFYRENQPKLLDFRSKDIVTEWIRAIPTAELVREKTLPFKDIGGSIVIIDDYGAVLSKEMVEIFTVLTAHTNTCPILLVQNLFMKNPVYREISLNATYIIIHRNPRDQSQIQHFAKQFQPLNSKWVVAAFHEATKLPHSYVLFDFHQSTEEHLRMRSNIRIQDELMNVYMEKK